jgi:uncharacterized membrane protein
LPTIWSSPTSDAAFVLLCLTVLVTPANIYMVRHHPPTHPPHWQCVATNIYYYYLFSTLTAPSSPCRDQRYVRVA